MIPYGIYGSIKQAGATIRINAQLIDSKTEDALNSFQIDGTPDSILHIADSLSRIVKNFLIVSKLKKEVFFDLQNFASANSPEAYRYYTYRQALSLEPERPVRLNDLAYFLIDKNINIEEGLKLINKAIEINPENYLFLESKGWGLYKLGKYKEALTILEKSWKLKLIYNHELYLHLEEAKKAIAGQK